MGLCVRLHSMHVGPAGAECGTACQTRCLCERARLILVGQVKQIRHAEGYPRFSLAGSLGDHLLLENSMDFVCLMCDPCKTNTSTSTN